MINKPRKAHAASPRDTVMRSSGVITVPISSGALQVPVLSVPTSAPRPADPHEEWLRYRCQLELEGQDEIEGVIVAYPGAALWARIDLEFLEDADLSRCRARLRLRAAGSGSPETHEFVRHNLAEGPVVAGHRIKRALRMPLPDDAPISYEGVYVKIIWSVAVDFLSADGHLVEEEVPLVVRPRPVDWRPGDSSAVAAAVAGEVPDAPEPADLGTHDPVDLPEPEASSTAHDVAPDAPDCEPEEDPAPAGFYLNDDDTAPPPPGTPAPTARPERARSFYMGTAVTQDAVRNFYDESDDAESMSEATASDPPPPEAPATPPALPPKKPSS